MAERVGATLAQSASASKPARAATLGDPCGTPANQARMRWPCDAVLPFAGNDSRAALTLSVSPVRTRSTLAGTAVRRAANGYPALASPKLELPALTLRMLLAWMLATASTSVIGAPDPTSDEDQRARAAFLYRLAFFVTWPSSAFASDKQAISLCIVGAPDPVFLRALHTEIVDREVRGRSIKIELRPQVESLYDCHIIYAVGMADIELEPLGGFLSVVDSRETLKRTGMLALIRESGPGASGKLVFHGRRDRIRAAPIELSAQLLKLVRFDEQTP